MGWEDVDGNWRRVFDLIFDFISSGRNQSRRYKMREVERLGIWFAAMRW